ncbi:hypothetical protein lerEdw1_019342 [Lerista edwardsae]|nr:hypothetical protein lerEdw1_019342 [Lerista edwardsae]
MMENLLSLFCGFSFLILFQVYGNHTWLQKHPGFEVLAQASHYWPLEPVEGINELRDTNGDMDGLIHFILHCSFIVLLSFFFLSLSFHPAVRLHNSTVFPSHNSTFVYTNDSAYSNFSATVDIVEGIVNKGICVPHEKGMTVLLFGSHQNSCITNPEFCEPKGVTFSFFWKTQEQQTLTLPAYGDQVLSRGFKIYFSENKGCIELFNRQLSKKWEARFIPPGPRWTHVLFTWKSDDGLKVYVNGTLNTTDPNGSAFYSYEDSNSNMLTGSEGDPTERYISGAFDEFIIWERVLTPDEIEQYFAAAVGDQPLISSTAPWGHQDSLPMVPWNAYRPIILDLMKERGNVRHPAAFVEYLENISRALPNGSLTAEMAYNFTEVKLWHSAIPEP